MASVRSLGAGDSDEHLALHALKGDNRGHQDI